MHLQSTAYAIPLLFGATVALAFCFLALQRYREPGAPAFLVAMGSVAMWSFAYAFEVMSPTVADKLVWHRIIYTTSAVVPAFWLLFVMQHEQRPTRWLRLWTIVLLIEPVVYTALTWTNGWAHHWLWKTIQLSHDGTFPHMIVERGNVFYLHVVYAYILVLLSVIFFLRILRRESSTLAYYQVVLLVLGVCSPVVANTVHILGINPGPINLTPYALITMGAAVGWFAFRFDLWDILPAAHDAVFANISDGVIILTLTDVVVDVNPAAYRLLNLPTELLIGKRLQDLQRDHSQARIGYPHVDRLVLALEYFTAGNPTRVELAINESEQRYLELVVSVLRDRRKRITGRILTLRDITPRREMELELQQERLRLARRVDERTAELSRANAELAQAARLKDEFLANMSHELRTPLNTILGLSEALQEQVYGKVLPAQQRALQHVLDGGRHLLALINDILDVSKIEAGKLALEPNPVAVDSLCQSSLNFVRQNAAKKQLTYSVEIDPQVKLLIGDERRLKQILVNLLNNAVKFTPEGGQFGLRVRGEPEDDVVYFVIWDTGIGIAEEDLCELFQPFVQLDSRLTRQHEGTGLGLALVHRMVELHGGSVAVQSDLGAGTTFTISLPWHLQRLHDLAILGTGTGQPWSSYGSNLSTTQSGTTATPVAIIQPTVAPPAAQSGKILLVEDNETNIYTFTDYLALTGHEVVVARSGMEALARLAEVEPALIIMDIQMPQMDGWETTSKIRMLPNYATVPIIAVTALAMPGDRDRCFAAGMNDYLSKPVSLRRLASLVDHYLAASPVDEVS
ncbi:MAG: histidine kinase N-terminal 7TM domain-containing protein [Caldilineaceae bacterium]